MPFSIPISFSHETQPMRLLELSPSLLSLLDGPSPPLLSFKAAPSDPASATPAAVVLTTPSATYQVREVQTSNSVFLLRPRHSPSPELEITAQAPSFLEVTPQPAPSPANKLRSPAQHLRRALPLYTCAADVDPALASPATSKQAVCDDVPFSAGEVEAAWCALCGFVAAGQAFRPSDAALAELWRAMLTSAQAEGVRLEERQGLDEVDLGTVWDGVVGDWERGCFDAVVKRLCADGDGAWTGAKVRLDRDVTVAWVGQVLMSRGAVAGKAWELEAFLAEWRDALPEPWRGEATADNMAKIQTQASDEGEGRVISQMVAKAGSGADGTKRDSKLAGSKEAVQGGGARRDWHERFKRVKR